MYRCCSPKMEKHDTIGCTISSLSTCTTHISHCRHNRHNAWQDYLANLDGKNPPNSHDAPKKSIHYVASPPTTLNTFVDLLCLSKQNEQSKRSKQDTESTKMLRYCRKFEVRVKSKKVPKLHQKYRISQKGLFNIHELKTGDEEGLSYSPY